MLNMGIEPMTFGVLCNKVTIVSAYKTNALPTELIQPVKIINRIMPQGGIEPPPTLWKSAMIPFHHWGDWWVIDCDIPILYIEMFF